MEGITNAANAASKAVFGDSSSSQSGQEPVSGQTGRGTASEPYDAGNTTGNVSPIHCTVSLDLISVVALHVTLNRFVKLSPHHARALCFVDPISEALPD